MSTRVIIDYTNWRGERARREIQPLRLLFGSSEHHPSPPQWLLEAWDEDKGVLRLFALSSIHSWNQSLAKPQNDMAEANEAVKQTMADFVRDVRELLLDCGHISRGIELDLRFASALARCDNIDDKLRTRD